MEDYFSRLKVNNWFINARRRILQPMLESSSASAAALMASVPSAAASTTSEAKSAVATGLKRKSKPANGKPPAQRFWPERLQSLKGHQSEYIHTYNMRRFLIIAKLFCKKKFHLLRTNAMRIIATVFTILLFFLQ